MVPTVAYVQGKDPKNWEKKADKLENQEILDLNSVENFTENELFKDIIAVSTNKILQNHF